MQWITPKELQKSKLTSNSWLIVDVRETYERDICAIEALHIPMAEMVRRHHEIDNSKSVVVMCKTGKRAEAVANLMECEFGFSDVYILEGGILNWIAEIDNQLEIY
jgi:adenylyltransferase/sulfurtransferase